MTICGIDPGFHGALALVDAATGDYRDHLKMPTISNTLTLSKQSPRPEIDCAKIAATLRQWSDKTPVKLVTMELVAASPNMGVTSAFRFGQGFGKLEGVIHALGLQLRYAYPSVWKATMGLTSDKSLSVQKACSLWPAQSHLFTQRGGVDVAESMLIAYFGRRLLPPVKQK